HLDEELARRVRARRQRVGDLRDGVVAHAQLLLVDVGVVDPVDRQLAELVVVDERRALVVPEAERLEEVLIDDVGAGRHDHVDHVVLHHLHDHLLQAGADQRAGQAEHDAAVLVAQHHLVDRRGARRVARLERHVRPGVHQRPGIEGIERDVLDALLEELALVCLLHHGSTLKVTWRTLPCLASATSMRAGTSPVSARPPLITPAISAIFADRVTSALPGSGLRVTFWSRIASIKPLASASLPAPKRKAPAAPVNCSVFTSSPVGPIAWCTVLVAATSRWLRAFSVTSVSTIGLASAFASRHAAKSLPASSSLAFSGSASPAR